MTGQRIVIVAFESAQVLDVTGPLEVFSSASRFWPAADYHTELVSPRGGPVQTSSGLTFATGPVAGVDGVLDTLVVAGGRGLRRRGAAPPRPAARVHRPPGHLGVLRGLRAGRSGAAGRAPGHDALGRV
jgi:transcriptional regulator GlxA family with amidase domain